MLFFGRHRPLPSLRKPQRFTGPKGILCHEKILGEEPSRVATLAPVCRDELSVMLPQISNLFWQARML